MRNIMFIKKESFRNYNIVLDGIREIQIAEKEYREKIAIMTMYNEKVEKEKIVCSILSKQSSSSIFLTNFYKNVLTAKQNSTRCTEENGTQSQNFRG